MDFDLKQDVLQLMNQGKAMKDIIQILLEKYSKEFGTTAASVWLLDEEENIRLYAAYGEKSDGLADIILKKGQGICGTCIQNNEWIISEDVMKNKNWLESVDKKTGFATKNMLSAPIATAQTGVFGCLQILNKQTGVFNDADKNLVRHIVDKLAECFLEYEIYVPQKSKM